MRHSLLKASTAAALIGLALAASGCREEEFGRPLYYKKGTYQGTLDERLPPETVDQLRQRTHYQGAGNL